MPPCAPPTRPSWLASSAASPPTDRNARGTRAARQPRCAGQSVSSSAPPVPSAVPSAHTHAHTHLFQPPLERIVMLARGPHRLSVQRHQHAVVGGDERGRVAQRRHDRDSAAEVAMRDGLAGCVCACVWVRVRGCVRARVIHSTTTTHLAAHCPPPRAATRTAPRTPAARQTTRRLHRRRQPGARTRRTSPARGHARSSTGPARCAGAARQRKAGTADAPRRCVRARVSTRARTCRGALAHRSSVCPLLSSSALRP